MTSRRSFFAWSALALALFVSQAAFAASAQDFVKAKQDELTALLKANAPAAKVDKVFDQTLDYGTLAKASLRDHWDETSEADKKEFTELLSKLVRNSYRKNLSKILGYSVEYTGVVDGEAGQVVRTVASNKANKREEPMNIDYVVRMEGPGIVDVVTDGSSMVNNYRMSFNRIIKKHGFPELLKRMKNKLASGSAGVD